MNYVHVALRASQVIPGAMGIAMAIAAGVGAYTYFKKRRSGNTEILKEKDDGQSVHVTGAAGTAAAGTPATGEVRVDTPSHSDSGNDQAAHETVSGETGHQPLADHAVNDDRSFFQHIWDLVDNEAKVSPTTKRSWYKDPQAMLRTKFRDSQPSTFATPLVRFMIFPVAVGVNVVFAEDRENPVPTVMYLSNGSIQVTPLVIGEIDKHRGSTHISSQALYYVYEKCKELEQVRMGKIHPLLAYPDAFKVDGLALKNHELKNRPDQDLEREFFIRVFDNPGNMPTITKMWSRSNACFVAAAVNRDPQPVAVRYQNLEGEKFLHVMDPEDKNKNLVLLMRTDGVVQIFRARPAAESINLSVIKGFEDWRTFTNEIFTFAREENVVVAHYVNDEVATEMFQHAA